MSDQIKIIPGGVTAAKGFQAAATAAHIKYKDRTDMALVVSSEKCVCAGTFTSNVVKAAPVLWDRQIVEAGGFVQAIVANSGIANACTGQEGLDLCRMEAEEVASRLVITPESVLTASTGVIGMQLPPDRLKAGIEDLASSLSDSLEAGTAAEKAIMTTDTRPKEIAVTFEIGGVPVTLGGMAKGSGMIHPNMCTMLSFLTTDLAISRELLQKALREVVQDSFNMISVDGDTSTNDTLLILANGLSGAPEITSEGPDYALFLEALHTVCCDLARKMAGDGEGATCLFTCRVTGADTKEHARTLAKSVICSSLTKAMIYGHDCNFGRVLCALGYSGVSFDPAHVDLYFESTGGRIHIYGDGSAKEYSEEEASKILADPEVIALVDMHMGAEEATAWGCDLSYDYVKINADYRS
ncbi:MAG: bifunctional glutamate N-acetyltransferase/amino-acid acetyltransferase ArgJ [Lachnospiraceae bacterium]|nr:bifunctional glutamate N-acetyltransferase/amino-acid acetyltransferase ArgJ [Lachnospiraceae bacterium]